MLYESEDGTMYEYLRERNANIEYIYGIWKNYDEPSEEGFIKFNQDGTYQYLLKKFNSDEMVSDSGTYILIENEVHLKSNSGQDDSLWFSKGKYLVFNSFMKALKRITVESMEGTFWRKL